jgi:membrane-associated protease RseP (regulator of RpoE activity)
MMGGDENPLEGGPGRSTRQRAFSKPLIVRFLIVFAGPAMNFVLAAAIFAIVFMTVGRPALPTIVGRIAEGGPAAAAGLVTGDRIAKVDGHPIRSWDELLDAVQDSKGAPLRLTAVGPAGEREVTVRPVRTKTRDILGDGKGRLGPRRPPLRAPDPNAIAGRPPEGRVQAGHRDRARRPAAS